MHSVNSLLLITATLISVFGEETFSITKKCSREDWECITKVAQEEVPRFTRGAPELGIEPLDPYTLKDITTDLAGLLFTTTGQAKGYRNAHLDRVKFDFDEGVFTMDCRVNMTLKGRYRANGRLLLLPIQGDGDIKIKAVDAVLNITAPFAVTTDETSQQHLHFHKNFAMKFEVIGNVQYTLTNLFNGNKELSDSMHNFLNTNWKLVSNEFAAPVVKTGIEQLLLNLNQLFGRMTLSDIFLD